MLYKKNLSEQLDNELFKNPTSEYRGAPFWAWNDCLDREELLLQIEQLKEMGFGGFHIHSRTGMATKYLGQEFMELVSACNEKGKAEGMKTWLYDEDRWPSGFAGGYVTEDPRTRKKFMRFTVTPLEHTVDAQIGYETGDPYLLACYDVCLNQDGTLRNYLRISENDTAKGVKWYVYVFTETPGANGRFNGQTYVDVLSKEAIQKFIEITCEAYYRMLGEEFGKSIPAIFTDEPQFHGKQCLPFATSKKDVELPYTTDLADTFFETYGISLLDHLPELLWDLPDQAPSQVRYFYHDHVCERFVQAFMDPYGKWCEEHGILLTGHVMQEDTLQSQTGSVGEAMRTYRSFGMPGIDMIFDQINLATAKQCQSIVNQYGREAMLSELYGATGWNFDFRGHKFQGDWQAALGVSVRVPHLSWYSMRGAAKRDYPASLHYQSAWYKEYPYIEDHYARLNTVLTRGKPCVRVGVIHPVESYWLHFGPNENTADIRIQLQTNFDLVTNSLLFGLLDFDYICESLLPSQYSESNDAKLHVGKMAYSAILVPGMETIRRTTLEILEKYHAMGGKLIFVGDCPKYVNASTHDCDRIRRLYEKSITTQFSKTHILLALEGEREICIKNDQGISTSDLIHRMRLDGDIKWFFLAHGQKSSDKQNLKIEFKGIYKPTVYDTITGDIYPAAFTWKNGKTVVSYELHCSDSLLLRLDKCEHDIDTVEPMKRVKPIAEIVLKNKVDYRMSEPNVLVLDMPQLSFDCITWEPPEEILRIDVALRKRYQFPLINSKGIQPWAIEPEKITIFPYLKYEFESEAEVVCQLAYEELCDVVLNGNRLAIQKNGCFVDKKISTMSLGKLKKGKNELIVKVPFGKRIGLESLYLLGDFGVRVCGFFVTITKKAEQLAFGSIKNQGFPFYGANIVYKTEFNLDAPANIAVCVEKYIGALIGVRIDGEEIGKIVFSPYRLYKNGLSRGVHTLELIWFGTRGNTFNPLHNCGEIVNAAPNDWYIKGADWSYEYLMKDMGILKAPSIEIFNI